MIGFLLDNWGIVESDIKAHYQETAGGLGLTTLTARMASLPSTTVTKRLLADLFTDAESGGDPIDVYNRTHGIQARQVANWKDL